MIKIEEKKVQLNLLAKNVDTQKFLMVNLSKLQKALITNGINLKYKKEKKKPYFKKAILKKINKKLKINLNYKVLQNL